MCHEGRASSTKFINPFIHCQIQSHPVIAIRGQCGEIERMYNAIEDIYILYIEEIQSINAVYTILSSRSQSFLSSFSALCTIPHTAALHKSCYPYLLNLHKSYSLCLLPLPGKRGIAPAITTPSANKDSAELSPCFPRRWMPPGRLHPR